MAKHKRNRRAIGWTVSIIRDLAQRLHQERGEDERMAVRRALRAADRLESKGRPVPRVRQIAGGMSSYGG